MAKPERATEVKPMPFPGESPTVSLALAAGRMYGLPPEEEKKPAKARPKRKTKAAKSAARSPAKPKARAKAKKKPAKRAAKAR